MCQKFKASPRLKTAIPPTAEQLRVVRQDLNHFLATDGGVDEAGLFHRVPRIDNCGLAELFGRKDLAEVKADPSGAFW